MDTGRAAEQVLTADGCVIAAIAAEAADKAAREGAITTAAHNAGLAR